MRSINEQNALYLNSTRMAALSLSPSLLQPMATAEFRNVVPSSATLAIDLGENQLTAIKAMVQARRQRRSSAKVDEGGFLSRASSLFGKGTLTLPQMIDTKVPLSKLARQGVIPADIVQEPNMTYKRVVNSYSVRDLAEFGFKWSHFTQLGLDVCDLNSMTMSDYHLVKVRADNLCEDLPLTAGDLVGLFKGRPHQLRELGFTFNHFMRMGMTHEQLDEMIPNPRDVDTYFAPTSAQRASMPGGKGGGGGGALRTGRTGRRPRNKGELAF